MRRPIYFLLGVLLATAASFASAAAPQTMYETGFDASSPYPNQFFTTQLAACQFLGAYAKANNIGNPSIWKPPIFVKAGSNSCYAYHSGNGSEWAFSATRTRTNRCLDGSFPDTSKPTAQQCDDPPPVCEAGAISRETFKTGTGPLGAPYATNPIFNSMPTSDGICNVDYDTIERCYGRPNAAGTEQEFYCDFAGKTTGTPTPASENAPQPSSLPPEEPRTPAEAAPFNPAQGQGCPKGTTNIGVDSTGGSICAGAGTSPSSTPKTEVREPTQTVNNSDGSTTQTDVTHRTNSDGSITTTTRTTGTDANGRVTITESSVTGDRPASAGGGAGTDDKAAENDSKADNPVQTGELYAKKDKTFGAVFNGFKTTLEAAPMVAGAKNFLTVTIGGASCPTWSTDVPYLNTTISMGDTFCTQTAYSMYAVIAIGLLIGSAYMAWRIAFL